MIKGQKHKEVILNILSDGKPHFSREFVKSGLLEYRRRITELRRDGYEIIPLNIQDGLFGKARPGYRLINQQTQDRRANAAHD